MKMNPGKQRGRVKDTKPPNTAVETHEIYLETLKSLIDQYDADKEFEWLRQVFDVLVRMSIHSTALQTGYLLTDNNNEELTFIYSGSELLQKGQTVYYDNLPDGSIQAVIVGVEEEQE